MTPAQVAHIMKLVVRWASTGRESDQIALEAALRDAPQQAEGWVMVPVDVLKAASESLGSFVSDHGWGDADMQAMDNLDAYLAARPSAPTAVEPPELSMSMFASIADFEAAKRRAAVEPDERMDLATNLESTVREAFKAIESGDTPRCRALLLGTLMGLSNRARDAARASKGTPK